MKFIAERLHNRLKNPRLISCLYKELWLPILPIGFPGTCFLTFLAMSDICSAAHFRLRVHALHFETATWNSTSLRQRHIPLPYLPLLVTMSYVRPMMMSRMALSTPCPKPESFGRGFQHVLFHCMHPQKVSLRRKYSFLFPRSYSQ